MRLSLCLGGPMSFCCFCGLSSSCVRLKGMMNTDEIRYDVGIFRSGVRAY
jgi:hypothetical protein